MTNKPRRLGDQGLAGVIGIEPTAEPTRRTLSEDLPATQGKKGQKRQRLNVSFTEANKVFLGRITRLKGVTVAAYINGLIDADRAIEEPRLAQIAAMLGEDIGGK